MLGIFPEGGSWAEILRSPRPGSAFLAARTRARILPVGLDGLTEVFRALKRFRRATITIRIGKPIGPFGSSERGRAGRGDLDEVGDQIMGAISELIPEARRGAYSTDPALREQAKAIQYPWESGELRRPS